MTFYILRHADKAKGDFYNPQLRHQDEPISQMGQEQAQKLVAYFADKEITRIYVSAYQRTGQTIAPLAGHLKLLPIVDERLNEIDNGLFDGADRIGVGTKIPGGVAGLSREKERFPFSPGRDRGRSMQAHRRVFERETGKPRG